MAKRLQVTEGVFMTVFSPTKYGKLLADTLPRAISNEKEFERMEAIALKLVDKGEENLSPEEDQLLGLLTDLLEQFEARTLPPWEDDKITPADALRFLMEQNDLQQADLVEIFGNQPSVSRALTGVRGITKEQAKRLGARFRVSAELFI